MRKFARWKMIGAGVVLFLAMAGCATVEDSGTSGSGGGGGSGGGAEAAEQINGAGASFPAPIYTAMFQEFASAEDGIQVNYQSIGSSGGREQFISETVAFGASDEPMSDEEIEQAGGSPVHIATVGGAVVPTYNVEGVESGLNFTGEVLAEIFLGNITNWSDPAIAEINPDADLPDAEITVVHRSDGSGTTNIWTGYLSAVSEEWESGPGPGGEIAWPTGVGGDGNEGVAGQVQQIDNSIGYNGLEYAAANDIAYGNVGEEGNFVEPSVETAQAALESAADDIPEDLRYTVSSANPLAEGSYPITGLTWMLVRQEMDDLAECKAVAQTAWYVTHDAQELAPEQNYVPVSEDLVAADEEFIEGMMAEGEPCYEG